MTMRAHNDQIAMTFFGDPHNAAGRISLREHIFDRRSRPDRRRSALKVLPQPIAITFRLKRLCDFTKGDVARSKRFRDVSNDEQRAELGRQVGGNSQRAFRAIGKIGRVQDDCRGEHSEFSEEDRVGMLHERN